jgi:hypothetical protein
MSAKRRPLSEPDGLQRTENGRTHIQNQPMRRRAMRAAIVHRHDLDVEMFPPANENPSGCGASASEPAKDCPTRQVKVDRPRS